MGHFPTLANGRAMMGPCTKFLRVKESDYCKTKRAEGVVGKSSFEYT